MSESAPDFDKEFYLRHYPDIGPSGMDPYEHFIQFGRNEGRLGAKPTVNAINGQVPFDRTRDTILVVSHEASMTGAPILSLNLVRGLQEKYNVVSLLLGGGPLVEAFREACVQVVGPVVPRHNACLINETVAQLVQMHDFKFAIVNSIESALVLEPLARASIPAVTMIHEFASYTRPRSAFKTAFFWASEVVFSTQLTYQDVVTQYPQLRGRTCQFLPQGRCTLLVDEIDADTFATEMSRIRAVLRPPSLPQDTLVVIGIGAVQIRKGVELFIDCVTRVVQSAPEVPVRFVWIGDPGHGGEYSFFLADQIQRAGLQHHVHFMDNTPLVEEVYNLSDMLLLTSRLDPLPGVAIEAMSHRLPVICFDRTTGIADVLAEHGMARECVVPYLDTAAMAARVIEFARSAELREKVGRDLEPIAHDYFDMGRYIRSLEVLALAAGAQADQELQIAKDIHRSAVSRLDFLSSTQAHENPVELIRWKYVRPWTAGFDRRKPFPGFHPGIYDALRAEGAGTDPVLDYLRAGCPAGPWLHDVITSEEVPGALPAGLRVALHLHVYYPELLPEMLERLGRNRLQPDLFVSVPTGLVGDRVRSMLHEYGGRTVVEVVPNRGRDIGPLLTAFGPRLTRDYDIVGHLHTKKTADVADVVMSKAWRTFLFENLLGGEASMVDIIVGRMAADPSIGMIFPDEPNLLDWGRNRTAAVALCRKLDLPEDLPEQFEFPVGTMFWARVEALQPLFDLSLDWADYPVEPLPYDGSMLHALERLLPFVVAQQGLRSFLTNVRGITR
ncbi:MAG: rhamnan synthesis F family protein [Luteimonas sp.]